MVYKPTYNWGPHPEGKWSILKGCNTMQGNKVGALAGILRNFQRYFSVKGTLRILF